MNRPYRDPDWLHGKYHEDGLTQREIAEECGVSPKTIRDWMKRHGIETREVAGENHGLYGTERDEEVKRKISETMEGREVSDETRRRMSKAHRGNEIDADTRERIAASIRGITRDRETRRRMSVSTAGANNPNWRGGYSKRYGAGWAQAREEVLERREVCEHCGHDGREDRLEVHHVVPVRLFRETDGVELSEAHVLENLVLLCKPCHGRAEHGLLDFDAPLDAVPGPIREIYE